MNDDRRHNERYNNERLVLNVARPGIKCFLRLNPTAECLNFSLTGLQFTSEQVMQTGEALVLDLCVYDIELMEIYAEVVSCTPEGDDLWCSGVKFCLQDKRMQHPDIRHRLLKIEDKLRSLSRYPGTTA